MGYSHGMNPGYSEDKVAVLKRLKRIEGQVRGIERMVEEDTYCIDVLTQISAATKDLQHCVADALSKGGEEATLKIKEAQQAIERLVKS